MPIWTDAYLNRLADEAEAYISSEVRCMYYRFSLDVTQGLAIYTLPTDTLGIRRITWKGYTVYPIEHSELRNVLNFKPTVDDSQSRPFNYLRTGYGYDKIRFFPTPNESVTSDDSGIYGSDIANRVIISTFRLASATNQLPLYIRRRTIRYYTMWKAYAKEGKGQNLFASDYFKKKFEMMLGQFKLLIENVHRTRFNMLNPYNTSYKVARPVLPFAYRNTYDDD